MARFFFHLANDDGSPDKYGVELNSVIEARAYGIRLYSDLLKDAAETFSDLNEWSLRATDDRGATLFTLMFVVTEAPMLLTLVPTD